MKRSFATMILAGGTGSRMGSTDKHKVCFEILGIPVIIRALETYNLCGSNLNLIVVGMLAEKVMSTVNQRFPATLYAFQEKPLGTGHAAKKGAEILERMGFERDVLVVAGDKVVEPRVIRRLLAHHWKTGADVTIATAKRPPESTGGIILKSPRGNIVGILEEWELQRLLALAELNELFHKKSLLTTSRIRKTLLQRFPKSRVAPYFTNLWQHVERARALTREEFESLMPEDDRKGMLRVGRLSIPAGKIAATFDQGNLFVYLFRAPSLYEGLQRLRPSRSGQEEYLTDVFQILATRKKPARIIGYEIHDPHSIMAFNNPKELLAIEEVVRAREGRVEVRLPSKIAAAIAAVPAWNNLFQNPSPQAQSQFRQWYGTEIPWEQYARVLEAFSRRYGTDGEVAIIRSPGRINLLGRHIDHQGGSVNVMAINREIILVASPRTDDVVSLANTDGSLFADHTFRISDVVANLNWDDWQHAVDGPRLRRILDEARGVWVNYIKAAVLRLQEQFRDQCLRGMDVMVSGDIPMGAGLSSSSALVVAAAEAAASFNNLAVSARRLVSLCGEGEWFVGTRGGAADHAAIKLSRRGYVTRAGFFPFTIEDSASFFKDHDLIVCNSNIYAGKSSKARDIFNEKVTAYHIGRIYFKLIRPDLAPKITYLRDISCDNLAIACSTLYQLLAQLPSRLSRQEVQAAFKQVASEEKDLLERLFLTHDPPPKGYPVRDVVIFGLSEMARARKCLELLREGNAEELGKLMRISHDGDRVSQQMGKNRWKRMPRSVSEQSLLECAANATEAGDISRLCGAYSCSLPEIDRIVDLAQQINGVKGAQMAGAGLGGCVVVLVEKEQTANALRTLAEHDIHADVFRPIAGACSLVMI